MDQASRSQNEWPYGKIVRMPRYNPSLLESKWQKFWDEHQTFITPNTPQTGATGKLYVLDMFPYPSGSGLHVGHPEGYTATDIVVRYNRMRGKHVLHPMGWDAFGLPAEEHAVKTGTHPAVTTKQNIDTFRRQLKMLGFSYDWSRELSTTDPDYYRWTQWIFLQLYDTWYDPEYEWTGPDGKVRKGKGRPISELPIPEEILARGGRQPSESALVEQTRRADALRSPFPKEPAPGVIRVYTTRPDTLFGVTYMVLAPEHPLVDEITTPEQRAAVDEYRRKASLKSDLDRTDLAKDKSGVFTGGYAINPVNGEKVPVWIADYVLISYGTGAIMAVPAHDERDWEFAKTFGIPIKTVVAPTNSNTADFTSEPTEVFTELGIGVNSVPYNGLPTAEFKAKITADLAAAGLGKEAVNYRLRDWLFSRQRYWGEPFPIWHELDEAGNPTGLMRADTAAELPVLHPHMEDFKPTGTPEPMLAKAPDTWLYKTAADGVKLKRETNSMPQWAGSCWYYLRFCDNKNSDRFIAPTLEKYWLPVDLYVGGAEHAVLHLLYSRFWHKVLFDRGHVTSPEPFGRLVNQGMILGEAELTAYRRDHGELEALAPGDQDFVTIKDTIESPDGEGRIHKDTKEPLTLVKLTAEQVEKQGGNLVLKGTDIVVESRSFKMSKSRGNVINPDDVVKEYGADSLRLYEMFMGPLEQVKPWSMSGVEGVSRFLARTWRMFVDERADDVTLHPAIQEITPTDDQLRVLHKTIKAVTEDIEKLSFNTAISRMMEFINEFGTLEPRPRAVLAPFALLLSPFAPHLAEELWSILGHQESLAYAPWPTWDEKYLIESEIEIPVQINGKLRAKIMVPAGADTATLQSLAEANATIQPQLAGKQIVKVVAVPGRMVNFVVKG